MAKAFLSHSSRDKTIVEQVAAELNLSAIHYDSITFENGITSSQNIFDALAETDVFVLFISKHSLKSPWVQKEISTARALRRKSIVKAILLFIVDATPFSALPNWIRSITASRLSSPKLISLKIASRLMELDLDAGIDVEVYIGRDDVQGQLKRMYSAPIEDTPTVVCVNGWHGIGRRTILRKTLTESFPWLPKILPILHMQDEHGPAEFYRGLLEFSSPRSTEEWQNILEEFSESDADQKLQLIATALKRLCEQRQVIIVRGDFSLVAENGDFQVWLRDLIKALPRNNIPYFCIACSRRVPPRLQAQYREVGFVSLTSLTRDESRQLLAALLKEGEAPVSMKFLEAVTPIVAGHPLNIKIAAQFARRLGQEAFQSRRHEFSSLFTERATRLVELVVEQTTSILDSHLQIKKSILKLFSDYEYLAPDELLTFFDNSQVALVTDILHAFEDFGILEWEGRYFRLAPFVLDAVGRAAWENETALVRRHAATAIIEMASKYVDDNGVRLSVIDKASLALIRGVAAGERSLSATNKWLQKVALPSHYLRVARELYDERHERAAIELADKCLAFDASLTQAARVEALRLKAMCHARLGQNDDFYDVVRELEAIPGKVPRRNALFLRGFKARKEGFYDRAEQAYRSAYALDIRNFHVLRELSHVLLAQDKFGEAAVFAEAAVDRHPYNSYALDSLLGARMGDQNAEAMLRDTELEDLFAQLEEASAFDKTSFFDIRRAYYYLKLGDFNRAREHADQAKRKTPNLFSALAVGANVHLASGDFRRAASAVRDLDRMAFDERTSEGKDRNQVTKLKVRLALLRGDVQAARTELQRAHISSTIRQQLDREVADAAAGTASQNSSLHKSNAVTLVHTRSQQRGQDGQIPGQDGGSTGHVAELVAPQFGVRGANRRRPSKE